MNIAPFIVGYIMIGWVIALVAKTHYKDLFSDFQFYATVLVWPIAIIAHILAVVLQKLEA